LLFGFNTNLVRFTLGFDTISLRFTLCDFSCFLCLLLGFFFLLLSDDDGQRLATRTGFANYFRPEGRVRLSLAGAQNKLAVIKTPEGLAIPLDGQPSTHILKLPNPDFKGLVENEALVLSMAAALALPVVEHEVVQLGAINFLLVKRYDRVFGQDAANNNQLVRLHQQDICQATGLPPDIKYESEGGPSLKTVFDIVRKEVDNPLVAVPALLNWLVFNMLVHNADAHAKNISILRKSDGAQVLAPFYDLVCTGAYPLDHRMAMSIGGQFDPGLVGKNNWLKLAADIGVGKTLVLKSLRKMAQNMPLVLQEQMHKLETQLGHVVPRRQQIERTIKRRVKKSLF